MTNKNIWTNEELSTGLSFAARLVLDDTNPTIEIDWNYLRRILNRLKILEGIAPKKLAENDILDTKKFVEKMLKTL